MDESQLFDALMQARTTADALAATGEFIDSHTEIEWMPLGGRENNSGTVEAATNAGRAIVERVTNAIDAVLEREHELHSGNPVCRTPREAAQAWLNVPHQGLSGLTTRERQRLADDIQIQLLEGEGPAGRIVQISDRGIGLTANEMPSTILSLNESNKISKHYLCGTYGQGGSATFAISRLTLIASRRPGSDTIAFTLLEYQDRPAELFKKGWYVYLTKNGCLLSADAKSFELDHGTRCRHFGYDLTKYKSPIGPQSVYGLLQQVLFDPIIPIWLDNRIAGWRRVIKGSRNALNGATDEGDESRSGGTKTDYSEPMFYILLGEYGRIGIEYWVLPQPEKASTKPIAAFVDPAKPVVLTYNGQNQAEMTSRVIKKEAELPYLAQRLICHVDCNSLTREALRQLFASSREEARSGQVYDMIEAEVVRVLKSDARLLELNEQARDHQRHGEDEAVKETMRKEVARLLRLQGLEVSQVAGKAQSKTGPRSGGGRSGGGRRTLRPIDIHEPPTYIRIVSPDESPIRTYPGQRRYVRIETDAGAHYHDPTKPEESRIAIIPIGDSFRCAGTTPLQGGRMRAFIDCIAESEPENTGELRVELRPIDLPTLFDKRDLLVVPQPPTRPKPQGIQLPPFDVRPVNGIEDQMWSILDWPESESMVASSAIPENGQLVVYYSTVFPRFVEFRSQLENKGLGLATSFVSRYEIWLAVHSLILEEDERKKADVDSEVHHREDVDNEAAQQAERAERCRIATLSAMFAAREVQTIPNLDSSD